MKRAMFKPMDLSKLEMAYELGFMRMADEVYEYFDTGDTKKIKSLADRFYDKASRPTKARVLSEDEKKLKSILRMGEDDVRD